LKHKPGWSEHPVIGTASLVGIVRRCRSVDRMPSEVTGWDSAYREEGDFEGPPPWNIGEPQPELAALINAGMFRSDVLDAGCGFAELSLALAADGYTVVGIDLTPTAISAAAKAAQDRGLSNATFVQDDITSFTGFDDAFNTVVARHSE